MKEKPNVALILNEEQIRMVRNDLTEAMQLGAGTVILVCGEPTDEDIPGRVEARSAQEIDGAVDAMPAPDISVHASVWTVAIEAPIEVVLDGILKSSG